MSVSVDGIRVIIIGDSMTDDEGGGDGDPDEGYLARALVEILPEWGFVLTADRVYGVGGSTLPQWLINAGVDPKELIFRMPGRWADNAQNPLSDESDDRTDLREIIKRGADVFWINLGTNDSATLQVSKMTTDAHIQRWIKDAKRLVAFLPETARVIWTTGNDHPPDKDWSPLKRRLEAALSSAFSGDDRVTVLLDDPSGAWQGAGVHPSLERQRKWVRSMERQIRDAGVASATTTAATKKVAVAAGAAVILGVVGRLAGWW